MKKVIFSFYLFFILPINGFSFELYQKYKPHLLLLNTTFLYSKSQANFNDHQSVVSLNSGNYFQKMELQLQAEAALTDELNLLAGLDINSVESNDGIYTRTNSALSKSALGLNYILHNEVWLRYSWQSLLDLNLSPVDENTDAVPVTDGAHQFINSLLLSLDFEDGLNSYARFGYGLKNNQLNNFILFDLGFSKQWTHYSLGLEFNGKKSLGTVDNTSKLNYSSKASAGSYMYNIANSDCLDIKPKFSFDFSPHMMTEIYLAYSVYGKNAAQSYVVGLALKWNFDDVIKKPILMSTTSVSQKKKKVNFQEDTTDGVNQDYFKNVNPEDVNYIQQIEGHPQGLKNATQPENQDYENQILKDEYLIKLKKKKK